MKQKLEKILGKVFGVNPKRITDKTSPENLPSWDSFNGLVLVRELEKNFNIKLDVEEMAKIKRVADIRRLLKRYGRL